MDEIIIRGGKRKEKSVARGGLEGVEKRKNRN